VWVNHLGLFVHVCEDFIVSVAGFQILISSLVATTNEINSTIFSGDRSRIKWDFKLHLDWSLLEFRIMDLKDVSILLVPLKGMNSAWNSRLEAVFYIVINSQVGFYQTCKILDNFVTIFV